MAREKKPKPEWQVRREAERAEAVALQLAFDGASKTLGKDAADSLVYGLHADAEGTVYGTAIAEDADLSHNRWVRGLEYMRMQIDSSLSKVRDLSRLLTDGSRSPADALRWSDDAFRGAAEAEVTGTVLRWLEEKGPAKVREYIRESLVRAASDCAPRSSSAPANLIEAYRAVAWSRMSENNRFEL